jgi:hypothetical protein
MIPNAFPANAAGQARYWRHENSACSCRWWRSMVRVIGMYFGVPLVPLVCA